ncbi:CHAT domain-containing protein [Streptomyces parvus]|uniref:CHAT domain-containing protein n=1 Tax=Streptomyces parvus TaxID=66428 RepID=A0A5D4JJT1_9ACTN|nr:CHAT domain-containing protein [Streptomyces parvus]TYR64559.1 CHAT domain-containing protein [Streptomyces parvus]
MRGEPVGEREDLLDALWARLSAIPEEGFDQVMADEALAEAERLAGLVKADRDDVKARYCLGWIYFSRFPGLPEEEGRIALAEAVSMFVPCFLKGATPDLPAASLPEPVMPRVLISAALHTAVLALESKEAADPDGLATAAAHWKLIVDATPPDDHERPSYLNHLGTTLAGLYRLNKDPDTLDAAIDAFERASAVMAADDPERAVPLGNLRDALRLRYARTTAAADLDASVEAARRAADVPLSSDTGDRNRARLADQLRALADMFQNDAEGEDDTAAVYRKLGRQFRQKAADLGSDDDLRGARRWESYASALEYRFDRRSDLESLDAAIRAYERALEGTATGEDERAELMNSLAVALTKRFLQTSVPADQARYTELIRQSLATTTDAVEAARYRGNLAVALLVTSAQRGDLEEVDTAVDMARRALADLPPGHPAEADVRSCLSLGLRFRSQLIQSLADAQEAVELGQASATASEDLPQQAQRVANLAFSQTLLAQRTLQPAGLDPAISVGRAAVAACPEGDPTRFLLLGHLAQLLMMRYRAEEQPADLEDAIGTGRRALAAVSASPRHGELGSALLNLGIALQARFEQESDPADLDQAIECFRRGRSSLPIPALQVACMALLASALETRGTRVDRASAVRLLTAAAEGEEFPPTARIMAAREGARLQAASSRPVASDLLREAVLLLPRVVPRRLERDDQQYAISQFDGLAADAAALTLADRTLPPGKRAVRALRLLEAGRAVLLSQALETRTDLTELGSEHRELADRYVALCTELERGSGTAADRTARAFAELQQQIRALPGFASFGLPTRGEDLVAQARGGHLVVFNVSRYRCDALVVTPKGVRTVRLRGLTYDAVTRMADVFQQALRDCTDENSDPRTAQSVLARILRHLHHRATHPALAALGHVGVPRKGLPLPRVWWAPGGRLGQLPIHAAGYHGVTPGRYRWAVMDRVISSYTPTIGALQHARQRAARAPSLPDRALVVALATTPGLPGTARLAAVAKEAALVRGLLPDPVLLCEPGLFTGSSAGAADLPTTTNVLENLPGCTISHFVCHGTSDPANPSRSRLILQDPDTPLTVSALAPVDIGNARLAYLSACSTAATAGTELLDESIHLTSAFQLAGFPHVIGNLWEASDGVAQRIAERFYAGITTRDGPDPGRSAASLHNAVQEIRSDNPDHPFLWAGYLHAGA